MLYLSCVHISTKCLKYTDELRLAFLRTSLNCSVKFETCIKLNATGIKLNIIHVYAICMAFAKGKKYERMLHS